MEWFKIKGKKTLLHKLFIRNETDPALFSIKTEDGDIYIVEHIASPSNFYYICETSEEELFDMLDGKITLRDLFLNKKEMYQAIKISFESDPVTSVEAFDYKYLPLENNYYIIPNARVKGYYNFLKNKLNK